MSDSTRGELAIQTLAMRDLIAEYQKEKRANFVLSGLLDVPATVTALFIYNNRGLSIRNLEIGVVRV